MLVNWPLSDRRPAPRPSAVALSLDVAPSTWRSALRHADSMEYRAVPTLDLATLSRFVVGFLIAAMIAIALTNPSGAQTRDRAVSEHDHALFVQCMQDWDRATHMTKKEWENEKIESKQYY